MTQLRTIRAAAVATVAAAAVLVGCGGQKAGEPGSGDGGTVREASLEDTRWAPRSVTVDGKKTEAPDNPDAYVTFEPGEEKGAGGKSGGKPGCNSMGADVSVEGDTVEVGDVVSTKMGCPDPAVQRFETAFAGAFTGTHTVRFTDGGRTATLTKDNGDSIVLTAKKSAGSS